MWSGCVQEVFLVVMLRITALLRFLCVNFRVFCGEITVGDFIMKQFCCLLPLLALTACTATDQAAESRAASGAAVPTEVRTDADRQAIYANGRDTRGSAVPDATPNTQRLGEQASDINRRKRIETLNTNDPNTTTPETRVRRQNEIPTSPTVPQ